MEAEESDIVSARKRTESYGAGSDSDLSDGWNFVDHVDTNQPDVPSSDGESVEVIEPDNDSTEQVEERQVGDAEEAEVAEEKESGETQLIAQSAAEVVPTVELDPPAVGLPDDVQRPEEMFDTSFCWFLFFSVSAVILSNVVFMAAESGFDWNVDLNILENTPSFLRDLPVIPKLSSQEKMVRMNSWTNKEDEAVKMEGKSACVLQLIDGVQQLAGDCQNKLENSNPKVQANPQHQKPHLKIDNINIGRHFQHLGDASDSVNAQNNFDQTLLILDALNIGLNDLEEVVTDNSELKNTLKLQKERLYEVLREIEFGVSRAMDKIASNVLFRVQKLERSFEREWCELEKSGHKEELKGLFYECSELDEKDERSFEGDIKYSDKSKNGKKYEEKSKDRHSTKDDYHYEVDKDSTGKYYSKSEGKAFESNEYVKPLKNENPSSKKDASKISNEKFKDKEHFKEKHPSKEKKDKYIKYQEEVPKKSEHVKFQEQPPYFANDNNNYQTTSNSEGGLQNGFDSPEKINLGEDSKVEYSAQVKNNKNAGFSNENNYKLENEEYSSKSFKNKDTLKQYEDSYKFKKHENYKYRYEQSREKKYENEKSRHDESYREKSTIERIAKYLSETCKNIGEKAKNVNVYEKLHKSIKDKAKIPIDLFNNMFQKYCKGSEKGYKENLKGEFRGKSYEKREVSKDPNIIKGPDSDIKNVFEFKVVETIGGQEEKNHPTGRDKVIEPKNKPRQWTFSYKEPLPDNKTKHNGDWFLKSGESRSKTRWSHHRSDWLFDRASYRRHGPHHFPEKRKNWFFRRAYARQQCRETPYGEWCDDKVTLPTSKFR